MGPEWSDLPALIVSFVALIVAGISAANQLASNKRPLPDVDLLTCEHLAYAALPGEDVSDEMVVAGLWVSITNRGHEPMLHPQVYDWTVGKRIVDFDSFEHFMPAALDSGESIDVVFSYSLANDNERVVGIAWEEASLFGREPSIMGVRYRISPRTRSELSATPRERWKRVGPFRKKGWQESGHAWSLWQPTFEGQKDPGDGSRQRIGRNTKLSDTVSNLEMVLGTEFVGEKVVQGREELTTEQIEQLREKGEELPG